LNEGAAPFAAVNAAIDDALILLAVARERQHDIPGFAAAGAHLNGSTCAVRARMSYIFVRSHHSS